MEFVEHEPAIGDILEFWDVKWDQAKQIESRPMKQTYVDRVSAIYVRWDGIKFETELYFEHLHEMNGVGTIKLTDVVRVIEPGLLKPPSTFPETKHKIGDRCHHMDGKTEHLEEVELIEFIFDKSSRDDLEWVARYHMAKTKFMIDEEEILENFGPKKEKTDGVSARTKRREGHRHDRPTTDVREIKQQNPAGAKAAL